ncbi:MAG: hypothetical protein IT256_07940 [Chitinophagaceae bacterium]|nr:hypothetical protein [Chitinophagaceae bacterium]
MTIAVKNGIINGAFENGERMEKLYVIFANRYIEAYYQHKNGQKCTQSWQIAFDATKQQNTVLQHLILGMNAHINLDLGIAASITARDSDIHLLRNDFDKINDVIGSLVNEVQSDLEDICFPMKFVRYIDNKAKDDVINFSIGIARKTAWASALTLSTIESDLWYDYYEALDTKIKIVANNILNPKLSQSILLKFVQYFEPKSIKQIIASLKD